MNVSDFDYDLPPDLIAQFPTAERAGSRMLVMGRHTGQCELRNFPDIVGYLRPDDCLVVNNTRVIPARLFGQRVPSGGRVEALLLEAQGEAEWLCLLRPGRRMTPGQRVRVGAEAGAEFTVVSRSADDAFLIRFDTPKVLALLESHGHMPLPPYIRREDRGEDRERYQTVYADRPGAVAAPTAGLHFTAELLNRIRAAGTEVATITLHVGPGTFQPVKVDRVEDHVMHEEAYVLPEEAAAKINAAKKRGGRVIAVGTTSVRVLESCADSATGQVCHGSGRTALFLHPPKVPCVVDGLLTNFHLPRSTLLMLVCTFSTIEHVLAAYRLAVCERMRFYSYGDCMLLL